VICTVFGYHCEADTLQILLDSAVQACPPILWYDLVADVLVTPSQVADQLEKDSWHACHHPTVLTSTSMPILLCLLEVTHNRKIRIRSGFISFCSRSFGQNVHTASKRWLNADE